MKYIKALQYTRGLKYLKYADTADIEHNIKYYEDRITDAVNNNYNEHILNMLYVRLEELKAERANRIGTSL